RALSSSAHCVVHQLGTIALPAPSLHDALPISRRRPPKGQAASKGYRWARKQAAKVYKKVARQRQDTARKWAKKVVRDHDVIAVRSEEHTSELQSREKLVCRLLLEKNNTA